MSIPSDASRPSGRLVEVALVFLRLGATAFGGPLVHLSLMREQLVEKKAWVKESTFVDFLSLANLLPGPTSTETAMLLGNARAGAAGLLVAGVCFILPSALLVAALAALYLRYGLRPDARLLLQTVQPVVVVLVATAILPLARTTLRTPAAWALFLAAFALVLAGASPLAVLAACGLWGALFASRRPGQAAFLLPAGASLGAPAAVGLWPLFLTFLKLGAAVWGSGYVLVAFLQADLVERLHWLTSAQLLDAVAVGQLTPGPVFTSATFLGWLLHGASGAAVATVAIFLPAFAGVFFGQALFERLRGDSRTRAFLDGVNAASLALMAEVTWVLGRAALVDALSVSLALAALLLLVALKANGSWVVLGAVAVGAVRAWLG